MKEKRPKDKSFQYYDGSVWNGYSPKQMKSKYPQGGYAVAGEVLKKKGRNESYVVRNNADEKLYLQPPGTYRWPIYRNGVFLAYKKDTFIAAKKLNLPLFFISFAAVICIILAVVFAFSYSKGKPDIDPGASKYKSDIKRPAEMEDSSILVPGYDDWTMKAGTDKIYMALMNPEGNPCYFKFIITRDDNNKVLFKTKLIPPGSAVTKITLPYNLKQGIYPITVKIKSYSIDNPSKEMNGAEVKTKIVAVK